MPTPSFPHRSRFWAVAISTIALLTACALPKPTALGPGAADLKIDLNKAVTVAAKPSAVQSGVYSDAGTLLIKVRGKSFLSVLDEAARLRRFNYTVLADISKFYIDYFDIDEATARYLRDSGKQADGSAWAERFQQQRFGSVDEFVRQSVQMIKESYGKSDDEELRDLAQSLEYKWTGDGFIFFNRKSRLPDSSRIDPATYGYKKIFLFNLPEREVSFYISRLLNIPYTPYTPNKNTDLPTRQPSTPQLGAQSMFGGGTSMSSFGEPGKGKAEEWQLFNHVQRETGRNEIDFNPTLPDAVRAEAQEAKRLDAAEAKRMSNVRWISIPQQNSMIIRADAGILESVGEMLHAIDSEYKQIVIEAKIFQYDSSTAKRLGLALNNVPGKLDISHVGDGATLTVAQTFGPEIANALPLNFAYLSAAERRFTLLSALSVYGRDGLVRVTAEPRILLKPGQASTVDITTTKLIQPALLSTASVNSQPVVPQSVEAGIFFTVRPTLLSDNKIQLDPFLKQSEFSATNEKNVLISTSQNQINTSIMVNHNELISLGGLERKSFQTSSTGVPGLKDLSGVGGAFGVTDEEATVSRVEFMVRAYVQQLDDQLSTPIRNLEKLNCRVNQIVAQRIGRADGPEPAGCGGSAPQPRAPPPSRGG